MTASDLPLSYDTKLVPCAGWYVAQGVRWTRVGRVWPHGRGVEFTGAKKPHDTVGTKN